MRISGSDQRKECPFPSVIFRICPALCEFDCRRRQDETVSTISNGFVCDYEEKQSQRIQPYKAPATDKNVAVIGGVEGLAAASFTARLGHVRLRF